MAHLMGDSADALEIMKNDDARKASTSELQQSSTKCQILQQTTDKNASGRQSSSQGHTFGVRKVNIRFNPVHSLFPSPWVRFLALSLAHPDPGTQRKR
ncbi:hypothetical protein VE03_04102 [Pseudogymnoascus sp. 23342-1-I1]|nr:hypothetical protein VE03_04102 [Pseudogymnoascus sp. 23342-1-I1]